MTPATAPFPRIGLVSWCSPESRYAGGEAIRRVLSTLPSESIRWCGFSECVNPVRQGLPAYRAFSPRRLHWRLEGGILEQFFMNEWQATRLAEQMWAWLRPFRPEKIWVVPEMLALTVGTRLSELAKVPVHATVHDAPEAAGLGGVPRGYRHRYVNRLWDLLRHCDSIDCVSQELAQHLYSAGRVTRPRIHVMPPTIPDDLIRPAPDRRPDRQAVRRIGHCGSYRISARQWRVFLEHLARFDYAFEIVSFSSVPADAANAVPANVTIRQEPYVEDVGDLIGTFHELEVDATYLGLWRDPRMAIFSQTSLSSKLTTYAAAGIPVIVDAVPETVAWRLVKQHGAGVRISRSHGAVPGLAALLSDPDAWRAMADGATRLANEAFSLGRHSRELKEVLCSTLQ